MLFSHEIDGKQMSEKEYCCYRLTKKYDYYISRYGDKHFQLLNNLNKQEYADILNRGIKAIKSSRTYEKMWEYCDQYLELLDEYEVDVDVPLRYFFYKCIGQNDKEYVDVICLTNPKTDGYCYLDDIYENGTAAGVLRQVNKTVELSEFFIGLASYYRITYKKRIENAVLVGEYEETLCSLPIKECTSANGYNLDWHARKKYAAAVKEDYKNSEVQLEWKTYSTKETRKKEKIERDCRWINETEMFKLIASIYPDAERQWRPYWLLSEKGGQMACDVYIPSLKVVFEYQGKQHFERVSFFDKTEESFERRQYLDKLKYNLLTEHKIGVCYINYNERLCLSLIKERINELNV